DGCAATKDCICWIQLTRTLLSRYATLPHSAMNTGSPPCAAANWTTPVNSEAGLAGGVTPKVKGRFCFLATRQPPGWEPSAEMMSTWLVPGQYSIALPLL